MSEHLVGISAFVDDLHSSIHTVTEMLLHLCEYGQGLMWNFLWSKSGPLKCRSNEDPDASDLFFFLTPHRSLRMRHFPHFCNCCHLEDQLQCAIAVPSWKGRAPGWPGRAGTLLADEQNACTGDTKRRLLQWCALLHAQWTSYLWLWSLDEASFECGRRDLLSYRRAGDVLHQGDFCRCYHFFWMEITPLSFTTPKFRLQQKWWWNNNST